MKHMALEFTHQSVCVCGGGWVLTGQQPVTNEHGRAGERRRGRIYVALVAPRSELYNSSPPPRGVNGWTSKSRIIPSHTKEAS